MATTPAHDEEMLVSLVSDIYSTLIHYGHFEESEVVWPSAEGHAIDLSEMDETARIDERVISLMKRLPLPSGPNYKSLAIRMKPVCFSDPGELAFSRDIDKRKVYARPPEEPSVDMSNALPTELMLLQGEQSDDPCLILDVADDTIRYFNPLEPHLMHDDYEETETDPDKLEAYISNHRNWPAEDATSYLAGILADFREAVWIPSCDGNIWTDNPGSPWVPEFRRRLIQDYGWPDTFRRADWQRDASDLTIQRQG